MWRRHCGVLRLAGLAAAALIAATVSGCGSGDSTVAKTPQATTAGSTSARRAPG
ncbi:MAG: LppP/LprE family lipoprotein, partial [Mycobacterium sp.]